MGEQEEKEIPQSESTTQPQEVPEVEPKETDKMLEKKDEKPAEDTKSKSGSKPTTPTATEKTEKSSPKPERKQEESTKKEEIIDIPETNETTAKSNGGAADGDERKMSGEEREVKPKKIPIGGLKLPGFFVKNKPKGDGDGADGELLEKENKEEAAVEEKPPKKDEKPSKNFGERLRSFFVRKPAAEKQAKQQASNADADNKSEATAEAAAADNNEADQTAGDAPPKKRGLLNAIKLPIANMVPKKKSDDDVELGMGKAGLASMETLDDSLKDQDCVDKATAKNGVDEVGKLKKTPSGEIKPASEEKSPDDVEEQPISFCQRLRSYRCSVDDALIALGILLFVLLIAVIGYVLSHENQTTPPIRQGRYMDAVTGCGMVEGLKEDGAFAFRGIPYALPPVGERRWRAAKVIDTIDDCWNGTLKAHNSSELCTQVLGNGTVVGDEDCLYLDVITRHVRYDNPLPVIVMIGADSLTGPSPGILRPSARFSRSHDVIYVRPNFRLGVFGFLTLDMLTKDTYPHTSGNYALTDIIAALNWIQLNIRHFGGDPKSVTLLGYRAGGTLVSALVTSKKAEGLYTRAWVSSASAVLPGKPLAESEKRNEELLQAVDCSDVACLRTMEAEKIWDAMPDTWLHFPADVPSMEENSTSHHEWLVLDGDILKEHPAESWKKEHVGNPKLVMGTTIHESHTDKLRKRHANWTVEEIRSFLEASKIGALNLTEEAIQRYNATNYRALVSMITDIRTICPLLINARLQPSVPFYVVSQGEGEDKLATVDADIQAILGRYEPHTVEQRRFVSSMQQLFYYYVSHGTVPQYDARRRVLNVGQDPLSQEDHANCNFWISNDIVPRYARVD
ncbi:neurotactin [Stomoxys calcitrans]|uniref:Carboxylesterase type B domain-containing protein n=1 Tax=Stomoxys calcitrans TaxID=35570 RepID=A0A1I8PJ28_STOCA|nr:neurotactin [Stomoxys calcitrans]XP_059216029.1 neurotactin [Stomoxys calcitrans]XP_059216031.1 neurotactin [Stomoxys calcitrans]XP_059216032.1 neurotactin [Stomoxys calcitrans]